MPGLFHLLPQRGGRAREGSLSTRGGVAPVPTGDSRRALAAWTNATPAGWRAAVQGNRAAATRAMMESLRTEGGLMLMW